MDKITLKGWVTLRHVRRGRLLWEVSGPNLVVKAGRSLLASIVGAGGTVPSHIACGSGTTEPNDNQTALVSEVEREALSANVTGNILEYSTTFNFTADATIAEFGIFNDGTAGTMLARFISTAFGVENGSELSVDWSLQFGAPV